MENIVGGLTMVLTMVYSGIILDISIVTITTLW